MTKKVTQEDLLKALAEARKLIAESDLRLSEAKIRMHLLEEYVREEMAK